MRPASFAHSRLDPCSLRGYRRREPEGTILYQALARHLETFLCLVAQDESRAGLPGFVERELRAFLDCGILAKGFARVHCASCGRDSLVAFSCKKRGICPSCGGRRMANAAARLVDFVLPRVPVRQWVLSLPYPIRFQAAYDPRLCQELRNIFLRTVFQFLKRRARRAGLANPQCGAVTFVQRFGGSLNLNVHFHALILDGVYVPAGPASESRPRFHALPPPSAQEIAKLVTAVRSRVLRQLQKRGLLSQESAEEPELLESCYAASVQGKIALGPRRGARVMRLGDGKLRVQFPPNQKHCARLDGFSLHAGLRVAARDRHRLERLCRYVARPAIVNERLSELPDGRILYKVKTPYADGTSYLVFDPLTFIEKLAALIPPPRVNLILYHGVLAPNARLRSQIVPQAPAPTRSEAHTAEFSTRPRNFLWADLMRRTFKVDVLTCPWCGGPRKLIALIQEPEAIRKILDYLGLPPKPPETSPSRPPPVSAEEVLPQDQR